MGKTSRCSANEQKQLLRAYPDDNATFRDRKRSIKSSKMYDDAADDFLFSDMVEQYEGGIKYGHGGKQCFKFRGNQATPRSLYYGRHTGHWRYLGKRNKPDKIGAKPDGSFWGTSRG